MDKNKENNIDLEGVKDYIRAHFAFPEAIPEVLERCCAVEESTCGLYPSEDEISPLEKALGELDESFPEMLARLISEKGLKNSDVYKRALVSKAVFSNIMTKPGYRPQKTTLFALAVSLKLNLEETKKLLERAGYALSHSFKLDVAMEYFIKNGKYDIFEINEILLELDLPILGEKAA